MDVRTPCPFCDITTDVSRVVYQGPTVVAILSHPRLVPGHLLVMPRRHVIEPWHLLDEELLAVYRTVQKYQRLISSKVAPGCDVRQNYRPFIPQDSLKVDHVHFHLLPRWPGEKDPLYRHSSRFEKELFKKLSEAERDKFADLYTV